MPANEWLPSSLGGQPQRKPGWAQQVRVRIDDTIQPARDNAAMAAGYGQEEVCCGLCPNLSMQERIYGCMGCFLVGMVISFLSFMSWWSACPAPLVCICPRPSP